MTGIPNVFEKIQPFYLTAKQKTKLQDGVDLYGYDWGHSNFNWYKNILKTKLRDRQHNLCCYCRRVLKHDKGLVEIEHVVNKSKSGAYMHFTFELKNLALSCKDCNNAKGVKSVLSGAWSTVTYPKNGTPFEWVHPYFHKYSEHITIHKSWVYEAKNASKNGYAVISKCKLTDLKDKEIKNRKTIVSKAVDFEDALKRVLSFVSEVDLEELCRELAPHLVTLMKGGADVSRASQAIRDANAEVCRIATQANA